MWCSDRWKGCARFVLYALRDFLYSWILAEVSCKIGLSASSLRKESYRGKITPRPARGWPLRSAHPTPSAFHFRSKNPRVLILTAHLLPLLLSRLPVLRFSSPPSSYLLWISPSPSLSLDRRGEVYRRLKPHSSLLTATTANRGAGRLLFPLCRR